MINKNFGILQQHMSIAGLEFNKSAVNNDILSYNNDQRRPSVGGSSTQMNLLNNKFSALESKISYIESEIKRKADYKETYQVIDDKASNFFGI